jgi:2-dehydro-3-deoxygluconokinase
MALEVVTFGEAMVRLSPPQFRRLEATPSLDVFVGGAELNTAVCLARLGHHAGWVSRLTDNPLGRLIANRAREAGVATEHVVWTSEDRVGLYFLEFGAAPRASSVVYDRKSAAIANITPGTVDWARVFDGVRWFHLTGITPALSPSAAAVTREALQVARSSRVRTSIDLNYRVKLWSASEAQRCMSELMNWCDVLVTTEEDVERVFGIRGDDLEGVCRQLTTQFGLKVVAITLRENPLVWRNSWTAIAYENGAIYRTRTFEVEIVDRLGAGDAFAAGLIHGLLEGDLQRGVDVGVAVSALKHSIPGDFAWVSRAEVEALLQGEGLRISR